MYPNFPQLGHILINVCFTRSMRVCVLVKLYSMLISAKILSQDVGRRGEPSGASIAAAHVTWPPCLLLAEWSVLAGNKNTRFLTSHNLTFPRLKRPERVLHRAFTLPAGCQCRPRVCTGLARGVFAFLSCCLVPRWEMSGWDCAQLRGPFFFTFTEGYHLLAD